MSERPGHTRKSAHRGQSDFRRLRLELLEVRQLFSAGSLDTSFAGTGVGQLWIPGGGVQLAAVSVQSDQKIVTAGTAVDSVGSGASAQLVRFNADGTLDASFGTGGIANALAGDAVSVIDEAIAPDGKIVISGVYGTGISGWIYGGFIAQFNSNGTLDAGFGDGGFLTGTSGHGIGSGVGAIAVQPDGKIVAAVDLAPPLAEDDNLTLERFNTDGTLDTSFGNAGVVSSPATNARAGGLAIETSGDIVLSGSSNSGLNVLQFDSNGDQLGSFSTLLMQHDLAAGVLVENDGSIVVAGTAANADDSQEFPFAARLTGSLALDPSFGQGGIDLLTQTGFALGLVEQPSGQYVLGFDAIITTAQGTAFEFGLARLNQDGSLDSTFGTGGLVLSAIGNTPAGIAVQNDGNLLFVGANGTDFTSGVGITARFLGNPGGVDQQPSFTKGTDQSVAENAGPQAVAPWATAISSGAAGTPQPTLSFTVQATNPNLFAVSPSITPTGTLLYTPAAGAVGASLVTVTLQNDDSASGSTSGTSAAQTFIINIGSSTPWQNPILANDVNGDGVVTPLDALVIINEINANGARALGALANPPAGPVDYLDVNGDGLVTPIDALNIINFLNAGALAGGNSVAAASSVDSDDSSSVAAAPLPLTAVAFAIQTSAPAPAPLIPGSLPAAGSLTQDNPATLPKSTAPPAAKLGAGPGLAGQTAFVPRARVHTIATPASSPSDQDIAGGR